MLKPTVKEREAIVKKFHDYKKESPSIVFIDCIHKFRKECGYFPTSYLGAALMGFDNAENELKA